MQAHLRDRPEPSGTATSAAAEGSEVVGAVGANPIIFND
jgi:hypothetical protein